MDDEGWPVTEKISDVHVLKKEGEGKYILFNKLKGNGAQIPVEAQFVVQLTCLRDW